jgi:hypothetical protein
MIYIEACNKTFISLNQEVWNHSIEIELFGSQDFYDNDTDKFQVRFDSA